MPQASLDFAQLSKLVTAGQHNSFRFDGFSFYGLIVARSMVTLFCLALWPCRCTIS